MAPVILTKLSSADGTRKSLFDS